MPRPTSTDRDNIACPENVAENDRRQGSWHELRGLLKEKSNGAQLSIEDINDAIAEAGANAGIDRPRRK